MLDYLHIINFRLFLLLLLLLVIIITELSRSVICANSPDYCQSLCYTQLLITQMLNYSIIRSLEQTVKKLETMLMNSTDKILVITEQLGPLIHHYNIETVSAGTNSSGMLWCLQPAVQRQIQNWKRC